MKTSKLKENMESLWKLCHYLTIETKNNLQQSSLPLRYKNETEGNFVFKANTRNIIFELFNYFYSSKDCDNFYFDANQIKFNADDWVVKEALRLICETIILLYGALFFSSELQTENYEPLPKIYKCIAERLNYQLWQV